MYTPSSAVFHVAGVFAYRGCNTSSDAVVVAERCHDRLTFHNPLLNTVLGGFSSIKPLMGSPIGRGGGRGAGEREEKEREGWIWRGV